MLKKGDYLIKTFILIICLLLISICIKCVYMKKKPNEIISTEVINIANSMLNNAEKYSEKYEITEYENLSYYIKIDIESQLVIIYTCDENNKYNIPVKVMVCSTGKDTPQNGVYSTTDKYEWRELYGKVYGQYATRITGPILFHSVPYQKQDKASLEYWEYDKLGEPASLGCVRLSVEDAKWIYDYCKFGTKVEFCSEKVEQNLILNKPIKISNYNEILKNWDPTDPDKNNPWIEYNK